MSLSRIYGTRLEPQSRKGGISPLAPPPPKGRDQSLPPILRIQNHNSMTRYSKAPRGLFVLLRAASVFTGTTISPSPSLRQRFLCYAIRAGRNLPDKELRYLRTVIVTAAVYWGLSSKLRKPCGPLTPPLDLPAPGRHQALYIIL